jgi:DNA-binding GntR family transcriptional regulator
MKEDTLSSKVYLELRGKMLSNQLMPGIRLKEEVWAKKMEVSRMAVREAFNRLLGENLLVAGSKGGYYIKSMNADDLREIRELREVLELGALRLAIHRIENHQITELEKICDDFTAMVKGGYFGGACEADVKFHEAIINIAGNEKLKTIYLSSNIPLFHLKLGRTQKHMDDYELTDREHRAILHALKNKNLKLAEEFLTKHLVRGELTALELE